MRWNVNGVSACFGAARLEAALDDRADAPTRPAAPSRAKARDSIGRLTYSACAHDAIAAIDQTATGLDRKRALQTLLAKPGALSALARDKASGDVVGAAISIVGRDGGRVIGPLLGSHEAALPLVRAVAPDGAATLKAIGAPDDILVETLTSAGFEVAVEQVSMSFGGHALPGKRDLYLGLMHPTLG